VSEISKRFGPVTALTDVSLRVASGEVVVLLGPNGSGKSTLMRILGTTIIADSGEATVGGHDVRTAARAVRRSVGFLLADERSWYWRLTGRHNLEFFAALYGLPRRDCREQAAALLEEVGLAEAADRPFSGYSSGMRLRLSLARALLSTSGVMLLDEPTRSLDPVATREFRDLVKRMAEQRQAAVLVATHDLHEAAAIASRVLILVDGRLRGSADARADSNMLEQMLVEASVR
jgi:ABC-2 type transport system ATP-binding protein